MNKKVSNIKTNPISLLAKIKHSRSKAQDLLSYKTNKTVSKCKNSYNNGKWKVVKFNHHFKWLNPNLIYYNKKQTIRNKQSSNLEVKIKSFKGKINHLGKKTWGFKHNFSKFNDKIKFIDFIERNMKICFSNVNKQIISCK